MLERLSQSQKEIVSRLAVAFGDSGHQLYLVGGLVRDLLLELPVPSDLDFTTDARPEEIERLAKAAGALSTYDVGARFGTIGLVFPEDHQVVEITTFRSELYDRGSRHPMVTFGDSLEEDLSRRDFTVNAMAFNPVSGELIDLYGGQVDLHQNMIRSVGDADDRFADDPLRLLRAVRFVSQLGFLVDRATRDAMTRQAQTLAMISEERIYAELTRLLTGKYASHGLDLMRTTGLIDRALPELTPLAVEADLQPRVHREKDIWRHTITVVDQAPRRPAVRWAALLHDAAKPQTRRVDDAGEIHFYGHERRGAEMAGALLRRLKADKTTIDQVALLVELHYRPETYEPDWTDSAVRRLMLDAQPWLDDLLELAAADVTSANAFRQREAAERIAQLKQHVDRLTAELALDQLQSPLDGTELMAMFDRPPGRWIAEIKDHLRNLVIDGELAPNDKDAAAEIARQMMSENGD